MTRPPLASWLAVASLLFAGCCARTRCAPPCRPAPPAEPVLQGLVPTAVAPATPAEPLILVEASYFRIPAAQAERVLGAPLGTSGRAMGLLSPLEAAALLERLGKERGVVVLNQPSLVTTSGQQATIFVGESYEKEPHRPPGADPYAAALADAHWSGSELHVKGTVLPRAGDLALDFAFVRREPPPDRAKPDPAALLASQIHGRMGVARMASGDSAYILVASGEPKALGDRTLLLATPRILPPKPSQAPSR